MRSPKGQKKQGCGLNYNFAQQRFEVFLLLLLYPLTMRLRLHSLDIPYVLNSLGYANVVLVKVQKSYYGKSSKHLQQDTNDWNQSFDMDVVSKHLQIEIYWLMI